MSDREVSVALFRQFLDDPGYPGRDKPSDWLGPDAAVSPHADCPVNNVTRDHMFQFCNWLSAREGRRPCYTRTGPPPDWSCDFTADGYRLPTEAEWDYAHRAGATTTFFFGSDPRWLPSYAQVALLQTVPGGSKRPNRWGLFDMVGNVWEACWDHFGPLPDGTVTDPKGPKTGKDWVSRGGAFDSGSYNCKAADRIGGGGWQGGSFGFRVVCGSATPTREPLTAPNDGRAVLAYLERHATDDLKLLKLRGDLRGRYGEWRAAAADYGRVMQRSPPNVDLWISSAPLLLEVGDQASYRSLCRRLLDEYGATTNPMTAERVAKACLLSEGDDLDRVMRLVEAALSKDMPAWFRPFAELVRGMAEYRRGNHAAALDWLGRCRPSGRPGELSDECDALRGFFLAMAHHRLGQHDEAAKAFEQARARRERLAAALATRLDEDFWKDVLRATIAEAEAKKLLESRRR
jgi:hypothetical protein